MCHEIQMVTNFCPLSITSTSVGYVSICLIYVCFFVVDC
jgi:hypothetical protein